MPNIAIALPETQQAISRPIISDIIKQIKDITKIGDDVKVIFPGEARVAQQTGSEINGTRTAEFLSNHYIHIEVEEDLDREAVGTTAVTGVEHQPIFVDRALEIYMKPVYARSTVRISFRYRTASRSQAIRWRNDIRMRVSAMRDVNLHDISYHYVIPGAYLHILSTMYTLRERIEGYGDDFTSYMAKHSSPRLTYISDLAGINSKLVISETQSRIVGQFDWDTIPDKPEKDESNATWVLAFDYKFTYELPVGCNMKYPIMVHNQLIPFEMAAIEDDRIDVYTKRQSYTNSLGAFRNFESTELVGSSTGESDDLIIIPREDTFSPSREWPDTIPLMFILVEVESDRRTLLNLNELGDYTLDSDVMKFIKESEYPYITKLHRSIIQLQVYEDNQPIDSTLIKLEPDMTLVCLRPLNLRKKHRIRLSIMTSVRSLNDKFWNRFSYYPKAVVKLIKTISNVFRNNTHVEAMYADPRVFQSDINVILKVLSDPKNVKGGTLKRAKELGFYKSGMKTLMLSYLIRDIYPKSK